MSDDTKQDGRSDLGGKNGGAGPDRAGASGDTKPYRAGESGGESASMRQDLKGATIDEIERLVSDLGEPSYRASQLASWIYGKDVSDLAAMTNLPAALRASLAERFTITRSRTVERQRSSDGTEKLLIEYADGKRVETVLLEDDGRRTACVSTQVGCRLACAFCATGAMGLERNLTAGEIVEQVQAASRAMAPARIENIVFMGMGEPLDNYDHVLRAVRALNAPWGLGVGARRMTISTAGLVGGTRRLAGEGLQVNLAISLNAPRQELREKLMPVARANPLPELIEAAGYFCSRTGRMVTLEYVLLRGVNDSQADALDLARLAGRLPCKINLICYNQVAGKVFAPPGKEHTSRFLSQLRRTCPTVVRRQSRGGDISAGCGQLCTETGSGAGDDAEAGGNDEDDRRPRQGEP